MSTILTLNNGVRMPALGLGVFLNPPAQTAAAVRTALETGYRLVDTAAAYMNERNVGKVSAPAASPRRTCLSPRRPGSASTATTGHGAGSRPA